MSKVFEDTFSELQADMIAICLEYVDNRAEKIFIHCSFEDRVISNDYFFCINGKIVRKHKLNEALDTNNQDVQYDTSGERQSGVLRIINEDIEKIYDLCLEYKREMPTEMKLIYSVENNSLEADYRYDNVYSYDSIKTANDVAMEWFEEIKNG